MRRSLFCTVAAVMLLGANGALAETQGEFGNACATTLATGKIYPTDCSINTVYKGKTYCFGGEKSKELFLKNPDELSAKARENYARKQD